MLVKPSYLLRVLIVSAACLISAEAIAQPPGGKKLASVYAPKIELEPIALPRKAINEEVSVALCPPKADIAVWYAESRLGEELEAEAGNPPGGINPWVNRIILIFGPALTENITAILQALFPRTTTCAAEGNNSQYDLIVHTKLVPYLELVSDQTLSSLQVSIQIAILDSTGKSIDTIEVKGLSWTDKHYWSERTKGRALGELALKRALEQIGKSLEASSALKAHLSQVTEARARPANLTLTPMFDENNALITNGRLDAGEEAAVRIEVRNDGPGPAYGVNVQATSGQPQVVLSGDGAIGNLAPGESKELALRITGTLGLPSSVIMLRIETSEKRGYGARPILFELSTAQLVPPDLEIVDVTLNDRPSSRAQGDGDGQPANGETLEAIVRVRNAGPGEATGVAVLMASPKAMAEILEAKATIPRIAVNRVEEARLLFRLPIALQASDLPLSFQAVDARGRQVGSANKEQTWKIRTKRPGLELIYRLYDGSSTGSTGNRDGLVNNGERIEVAVTPTNRGELPARGVRIEVESGDPKLVPRPAVLEVGDLPAQTEGAAQRFTFDVPRGYGSDRSIGDLRFTLNISQQDFPPAREPVALSFRVLRPELSLETALPSITRGTSGELILRLRNAGTLRAEEVTLEVTPEATGVDLLDERDVPVPSWKILLGALDPQGPVAERRVRINVRRSAPTGSIPLHIALSQKDFPAFLKDAVVAVSEEPPAVIAAARGEEGVPDSPSSTTTAAPATISFLRNTQGEHLIAEAIVLRFEVQSPAELAEVRLTQNDRLLPIEAARRAATAAGGLQVTQYEIPVQLEEGENRFEVVAVTRQGLRSTRPLTLIRDPEVGRLWVVSIGVSKYQDPSIASLRYADADARAVFDYFRDTFGLPESQVFLRVNEQATLREVKSVLGTQLVTRANDPRDTVILYLAGHGMRDRVTGSLDSDGLSKYFLPFDAHRADLYSTSLEMDEVTNILRRLTPERVVVLLDSCFSGAAGGRSPFDPRAEGERALITGEFLDRMARVGKGRVVLTASGPEESAQESADFGHGVFTYYLLDGLRGAADLSGDGEIDVHEIYRYVSEKVTRETKGRQNPKLKEPDLVGRILLGRGAVRSRR